MSFKTPTGLALSPIESNASLTVPIQHTLVAKQTEIPRSEHLLIIPSSFSGDGYVGYLFL